MSKKVDAGLVLYQGQQLIAANDLLRTPPEELDDEAKATAWSVLDLIQKKVLKGRMAELRKALLKRVRATGDRSESSGRLPKYSMKMGGAVVTCTDLAGKVKYDEEALKVVLARRSIPEDRVFKTVQVLDEEAVEMFIAAKIIEDSDVMEFTEVGDPSERLTVKKSKDVLALLPKE